MSSPFFVQLIILVNPQMAFSVLSLLLVLHLGFGQSSHHQHLHEDHYIGQQHNPEHDMKVLLGEEVSKYNSIFDTP